MATSYRSTANLKASNIRQRVELEVDRALQPTEVVHQAVLRDQSRRTAADSGGSAVDSRCQASAQEVVVASKGYAT